MLISSRFVKIVSPLAVAIALASCGGSTGSFGEGGTDNVSQEEGGKVADELISSIDLQSDSSSLLADGSNSITITAIVKDIANNALDGAEVFFTVDNNATLVVAADGSAVLTPNGAAPGTILTVTATSGLISKSIQVLVIAAVGVEQGLVVSSIDLQADSTNLLANSSAPVSITAIAKNAQNNSIDDAVVIFSVDNNATLIVTGNVATLKPNGATPGTVLTVSATSGEVTNTILITVTEQEIGQATDIEFSASSRLLPSDGTKPVTLTATAKDANNNAISSADITFSVDNNATINTEAGQTGTVVTATLTPGEPRNRTLNVTATSGNKSKTIVIEVVGTTVVIDGPAAITLNNNVEYLLKLKDSADKPIAFEAVQLSSAAGNTITTVADLKTDASGEIAFTLNGIAGGTDTVVAKVLGVTYEKTIQVSGDQFILSGDAEEVNINTNVPIEFVWTKDGVPQANKQITISATRGIINNRSVTTDSAGKAFFSISSTTAGQTVISATSTEGLATSLEREFVAITPAYLNSQAEPSTIAPNTSSTIIAKIRDINDNPVKNKTIDFRLKDTVNGILSASTAVTDSLGRASVSYTAGNSSSAKDGVVIDTFIQGYPTVASDEVLLTVGGQALRIVLGNDQLISSDEVFYVKKYGVIVTDSAGNPIKDQEISFTITPVSYNKGFMRAIDTDGDGKADKWAAYYTSYGCISEDFDNDGNLDFSPLNEDLNHNGTLEPTHDATITNTGITDDKGKIVVEVIYPKSHALWSKQRITAKTTVEGTEFVENTDFYMDILDADVNNVDIAPPNNPSPYGRSDSCFNTDGTFNTPITPQVIDAVTRLPVLVLEHGIWYTVKFTDALNDDVINQTYSLDSTVVTIEEDAHGNFRLQDQDPTNDQTGFNIILNYSDLAPIPLYYKDEAAEDEPVPTDTTGPEIFITGNNPATVFQGKSYFDAGAQAIDDVDGVVVASVALGLPINTSILGTHTILYQATDAAGNKTSESRTVIVVPDTIPPTISLIGSSTVSLTVGDFYGELGATATDNADGDVSGGIVIGGSVNTAVPGTYFVTYNVIDSSGNVAAEVTRSVLVNP